VPLPRLTILLYRVLPFFWYGVAYFCFLFADRFAASAAVAALSGAPFGLPPGYKLGMDLALMTFLLGSAAIEFANLRFTLRLREEMRDDRTGLPPSFAQRVRQLHRRALTIVGCAYIGVALGVAAVARPLLGPVPPSVWRTLVAGDAGYLLLAVGLLNALALFSLNRPWHAVRALTAGLAVNLVAGFALSHVYGTYYAAIGLAAGAAVVALGSTMAVRRALARADYAVAIW
jgi:hypothetical protein